MLLQKHIHLNSVHYVKHGRRNEHAYFYWMTKHTHNPEQNRLTFFECFTITRIQVSEIRIGIRCHWIRCLEIGWLIYVFNNHKMCNEHWRSPRDARATSRHRSNVIPCFHEQNCISRQINKTASHGGQRSTNTTVNRRQPGIMFGVTSHVSARAARVLWNCNTHATNVTWWKSINIPSTARAEYFKYLSCLSVFEPEVRLSPVTLTF